MRKAIAMLPVVSAIYPMITGATAPPTIVMINNEEIREVRRLRKERNGIYSH